MLRLIPTADTLVPAPLGADERIAAVRSALVEEGIFARRLSHASSVGLTITYAFLSEAADAGVAAEVLVEALDWEDTDVSTLPGAVAVSTRRG